MIATTGPLTESVRTYLDQLIGSLKHVSQPIDPSVLRDLHGRQDYRRMLGWIKRSMRLDLVVQLRIVDSSSRQNPMWIEMPTTFPPYGTEAFHETVVIVNVHRHVLTDKPFNWIVAGLAHELSHVVLESIGHPLKEDERAVDLTAMILGYSYFIVHARTLRQNSFESFGYLITLEAEFADEYLREIINKPLKKSPNGAENVSRSSSLRATAKSRVTFWIGIWLVIIGVVGFWYFK